LDEVIQVEVMKKPFAHTHRDENYLAATAEMLFVHVAFADRRSTEMSPVTQARLAQIARVHGNLPKPDNLGRKIEIRH